MPAEVVVDASAAVRVVFGAAPEVRSVFERDRVVTPGLFAPECANALVKYVRVGQVEIRDATRILQALLDLPTRFVPSRHLAAAALTAAAETRLSVYDASYLVLARSLAATLYTADRDLASAYERSELIS